MPSAVFVVASKGTTGSYAFYGANLRNERGMAASIREMNRTNAPGLTYGNPAGRGDERSFPERSQGMLILSEISLGLVRCSDKLSETGFYNGTNKFVKNGVPA